MPHAQLTPQPSSERDTPPSTTGRRWGLLAVVGAVVLILVLLVSAAAPAPARALGIGDLPGNPVSVPGHLLGGLFSGLFGGLAGDIASLAVGGFDAIIKALFAPIAKFITVQLIGWMVAVPDLTQGNIAALQQTVEAMAGGTLGAVATFAVIRYWTSGFAGGGDSGFTAIEGLGRTIAAALFLAVWPSVFATGVNLTNLLTSSLMGSGAVVHSVSHLLAAGLGAGVALQFTPVGLFVNIALAVAASLLFLGLLLVKLVVSISTILVFVGMPLAVVLWPVVPWVARMAGRAFAVCLMVPVLWALCFAASAAVSLDAITFNAGSVIDALLEPLVAIVLLWVMLRLPVALARLAMLGSMSLGGGFASRTISYAAGSQLRDTARSHLPSWAAGQTSQTGAQGQQAESGTDSRLRSAATLASATATGGTTAAAAASTGVGAAAGAASTAANGPAGAGAAESGANGRGYTPPPSAQANPSGPAPDNGLQTPSFAGREQDFANETFAAQHRERTNPVSAEQATAAMASLPPTTQRAVGQLVAEHGAGAREHLAYQALGEWSPQEREALRTLAAATPEVRAQAASDVTGISGQGASETSAGTGGGDERSRGPVPEPVDHPPAAQPSPTLAHEHPAPARGTDPHPPVDSRPAAAPPSSPPHAPMAPRELREPRGPRDNDHS
jgi:hypothetical protein